MTADGTPTLFRPDLEEHYHSLHGAQTESQYVFIDRGLRAISKPELSILEVGFGTGLNALLTLEAAHKTGQSIHYHGVEAYPIAPALADELQLPQHLQLQQWQEAYHRMHRAPHLTTTGLAPGFALTRYLADVRTMPLPKVDVIYLDAFAPTKQPELWDSSIFRILYDCLLPGGVLTTYSAKSAVKHTMQAVGLEVEKCKGPPGKRHMLRGFKPI
jgi:tRNA U34 5-methylaminomethyl-2-thiouridine-forming methyltransferase MnmC